ncbi:MAG: hypothetical protein R2716_11710 [Microthrixaceae bacterium]
MPQLHRWCPPVRGGELCSATDQVHRVADPDGARRFLERHGARPGEGVSTLGTNGGFSTRGLTVSADISEVSVLVGCLANGRYGTGPRMLEELRRDEPWIGDPVEVGTGVIPLRRTYARITSPGIALVGDAACQVFPAHGSGIGMGLMAGTMLAETVEGAPDPGWRPPLGPPGPLAPRVRRHSAQFDGFRRMSTALGAEGVAEMMGAGLMTEADGTSRARPALGDATEDRAARHGRPPGPPSPPGRADAADARQGPGRRPPRRQVSGGAGPGRARPLGAAHAEGAGPTACLRSSSTGGLQNNEKC